MGLAIEQVIRDYFPEELIDPGAFDDWSSRIRQDVLCGAANLVACLDQRLESTRADALAQYDIKRDFWERFGGEGDLVVKSVKSIRSKLARDLQTDLLDDKEVKRHSAEELLRRVCSFGDLGRVRIVADFPSDIVRLQAAIFDNGVFLGQYPCPKGIKDFIFDPEYRKKTDGLKGHRARQFSVRVPVDTTTDFGFEVQLMTRLQHAWDRRNHPLYEWQRENPAWKENAEAVELAVDDFACAEALHLVDRQADRNWMRLLETLKKERHS